MEKSILITNGPPIHLYDIALPTGKDLYNKIASLGKDITVGDFVLSDGVNKQPILNNDDKIGWSDALKRSVIYAIVDMKEKNAIDVFGTDRITASMLPKLSGGERVRSRSRSRSHSRSRSRSPGRARRRSPSRVRSRAPNRAPNRARSRARSRSPGRARSRSPGRARSRSPGRATSQSHKSKRPRKTEKPHKAKRTRRTSQSHRS